MKQVNTLSKNKQQAKINPLPLLQNQYHAAAAAAAPVAAGDDDDDDDDDDDGASWYSYLFTKTKRERLLFFALWLSFTPLPSSCANVTMLLNVVHNMATLSDIVNVTLFCPHIQVSSYLNPSQSFAMYWLFQKLTEKTAIIYFIQAYGP